MFLLVVRYTGISFFREHVSKLLDIERDLQDVRLSKTLEV